ncbi:MAG: hypothetical protein AAF961_13180 [Planctomycetota bacterium]
MNSNLALVFTRIASSAVAGAPRTAADNSAGEICLITNRPSATYRVPYASVRS